MLFDASEATEVGALHAGRRQIWFDGPDGAYLAAAALRRYLDAGVVADVVLVPSGRGPALELPAEAVSLRLVQALLRRFGGHVGAAGPDLPPIGAWAERDGAT